MTRGKKDKKANEIDSNDEFLGCPDDKKLIVQMHKEMWERLRRLAFELNVSMAKLCREGITLILEKYEAILSKK